MALMQSLSSEPNPQIAQPVHSESAGGGQTPAGSPSWSYSVSVRSLCEFTAKQGDLDRRFTPSATALEGLNGQAAVRARRSSEYQSEIALVGQFEQLIVRGRADGYDPARRCLEEVKTIRGQPDEISPNRRQLHWAQLETYGAMFCREHGLTELSLALVYFDLNSQTEVELHQLFSVDELDAAFKTRCGRFLDWAWQEARHRERRDLGLSQLTFPLGELRPGQRTLAEAVYRSANNGRCLLAQAPTGIGKTLGALFPMLRAMPAMKIDRVAYLTCKGTARTPALEAMHALREATPGRALRVIAIVAKDQSCEHPDKACHGESCPLAGGFYDRLPAARAEAVRLGWLDPAAQRRIALAHRVCPYYLGQELLRWADVLVGDVYHAFDANGQLWGLAQAMGWRIGLLIDEAHNLVDRARRMYSAELSLAQVRAAMQVAPAGLHPRFIAALGALEDAAAAQTAPYAALDEVPDALALALQALTAALGEHLQKLPLEVGQLLNFHFELIRFQKLIETFGEHSLFDIGRIEGAQMAAGSLARFEAGGKQHHACQTPGHEAGDRRTARHHRYRREAEPGP